MKNSLKVLNILTFIIIIIGSASFVSAALTDNLISYYAFDGDFTDETGTYDASQVGGVTATGSGKLGTNSYTFDGVDDVVNTGFGLNGTYTTFTYGMWFQMGAMQGTTTFGNMISKYRPNDAGRMTVIGYGNDSPTTTGQLSFEIQGDVGQTGTSHTYADSSWHYLLFIKDSTTWYGIVDNVLVATSSQSEDLATDSDSPFTIGARIIDGAAASSEWTGVIDEVAFWNRAITHGTTNINDTATGDAAELYNSGSGLAYPFSGSAPVPSLTISEDYILTESELTNSTYTLNIEWELMNISNTSATLIYDNNSYSTIKTTSYNINGSANHSTSIITPIIDLNNTDKTFYWYYSYTNSSGTYQINTSISNQSLLWNRPRLNITRVYNAYSGQNLTSFFGNISKGNYTYNFSTTNNYSLMPILNGTGNYSVYVENLNYSIGSTNTQTLILTNTSLLIYELEFGLYSNNSILMYIRSEETGSFITDLIDVTISSHITDLTYNTTTGILFVENLADGSYTIKFDGSNYALTTYIVSVADRSTKILNAYLSSSNETTTFNFIDDELGSSIEGVAFSVSRIINGTWTNIFSKFSDITGRVQFVYNPGINYRFSASKSGYSSKTFNLDPVIFSTYNVRLSKILTTTESYDYSDVSIIFNPKTFYNDVQTNMSFYFNSPLGLFESYSANITYPGGSTYINGNSSTGETFNPSFNITGANFTDQVKIFLTYDTTFSTPRTFTYYYSITGSSGIFGTGAYNDDNPYGLSLFDRVFIVTIALFFIGGLVYAFAGLIASGLISIVMLGYFMNIGLLSAWFGFPTIIILILVISWRSSV